jgi:hypothetical protein
METLLELSWRAYPASFLMAFGCVLLVRAGRAWRTAASLDRDPPKALAYARGFRTGILGLCAASFGIGWLCQIEWLLAVSLIVLGEEMLEIGVMIAALRARPAGRPRESRRPAGGTPSQDLVA